jgi:hypothetical protein
MFCECSCSFASAKPPRLRNITHTRKISFSGLVIQITISCRRPEFGKLQISKSSRNTCIAGLVRLKVGILSCHHHLRRKCWSVVNFIEAVSAPHSSSEICQPFFENENTRPVQTQHKDNSFYGKRNIAKFTRSTIWGVQLKSGDN